MEEHDVRKSRRLNDLHFRNLKLKGRILVAYGDRLFDGDTGEQCLDERGYWRGDLPLNRPRWECQMSVPDRGPLAHLRVGQVTAREYKEPKSFSGGGI